MSITPKQRNINAKQYIKDLYAKISHLTNDDFSSHSLYADANKLLMAIIHVDITALGFRGLVLTAIVGKYLNSDYDFLNNFYGCKPRSIFEKGIFEALRELKIPCGKSDPLNVAKGISVLNDDWAKGRKPKKSGEAVVNYLRLLNDNFKDDNNYSFLVDFFMFRLKELGDIHANSVVTIVANNKESQQELAIKLWSFISTAVEGGTVPQFFIGTLLEAIYLNDPTVVIEGTRESVSSTSTTSKKPGDLTVVKNDRVSHIYEVTLKIVDNKRLSDSYDVLVEQGHIDTPITFLCRISEDTQSLSDITYSPKKVSAFAKEQSHTFNFVDIESFICSQINILDDEQIDYLLLELSEFISEYDRPLKTKEIWNGYFSAPL